LRDDIEDRLILLRRIGTGGVDDAPPRAAKLNRLTQEGTLYLAEAVSKALCGGTVLPRSALAAGALAAARRVYKDPIKRAWGEGEADPIHTGDGCAGDAHAV